MQPCLDRNGDKLNIGATVEVQHRHGWRLARVIELRPGLRRAIVVRMEAPPHGLVAHAPEYVRRVW